MQHSQAMSPPYPSFVIAEYGERDSGAECRDGDTVEVEGTGASHCNPLDRAFGSSITRVAWSGQGRVDLWIDECALAL